MRKKPLIGWGVIALVVCAAGTWSCTSNECKPNPGVCPPSFQCVDGFRNTGSASCEDGQWVCGRIACTSDGGGGQ